MSDKNYQPNYQPTSFSKEERRFLGESRAVAEVERVARNTVNALNNPETPEIVKVHIKHYLHDLVSDFTENERAVEILYLSACRQISEIPFTSRPDYIEALTGNDKSKAISATKDSEDLILKPISDAKAKKLVIKLFDGIDIFDESDITLIFSGLVYAVAGEMNSSRRNRLATEIIHQAFYETLRYGVEYDAFLKQAVGHIGKLPKSK